MADRNDRSLKFVHDVLVACGAQPVLEIATAAPELLNGFRSQSIIANAMTLDELERADVIRHTDLAVAYHTFDTLDAARIERIFATLADLGFRYLVFQVALEACGPDSTEARPRNWWENALFRAGFRKHPRSYRVLSYSDLEWETESGTLVMEKVPEPSLTAYLSITRLMDERALYVDMARETGRHSDGHMVRYDHAAALVRPGDMVVDAACGLGYGSAMIAACSSASRVVGVDVSASAIDYANLNYGAPGIEFRAGSVDSFAWLEDASVDLFVSFETLEHVSSPRAFLKEVARVLKPTGRLLLSISNLSADETSQDSDHLHDLSTLIAEVSPLLIVECAFGQTAGGGRKFPEAARRFWKSEVSSPLSDAEWIILTAMKSHVDEPPIPYRETSFPIFDDPNFHVTAFDRDYANPWIYKGLISIPWRLQDPNVRNLYARQTAEKNESDIDRAAALTVIGYSLLALEDLSPQAVDDFKREVQPLLIKLDERPICIRWKISLNFLLSQMCMMIGRTNDAVAHYHACIEIDSNIFSPILAIKTVEACYNLGLIALQQGTMRDAGNYWKRGIKLCREALNHDWLNVIGSSETPLTFGLPELSLLLDLASRCAFALDALPWHVTRPGYVYTQMSLDWTSVRRHQALAHEMDNKKTAVRLTEASRERQELFDIAEERLTEMQRLAREHRELFEVAEERLLEMHRLSRERQELFDVAEERLAQTHRLSRERQELYDVAEGRLAEVHRLARERQEFFDVAEERLAETHRLSRERQELYDLLKDALQRFIVLRVSVKSFSMLQRNGWRKRIV
ncbi:class I SAM-dependent methyltransferase [Xaviernesmea oryzae]|uniref:class I SAM-dependent methyltransferase n=1 Tax=Xaviernesmea oryzae TaxID=464029 RepID=UPI0008BE8EC0|nr:methyltransferase domain-containing protein [Xaviernesmea oryzae]SEK23909.1 Methyltransferase domain-containing protein [Xaviernesmea oryzae]